MSVFRYKFSSEFLTHLKQFTIEHYREEPLLYKLSWDNWIKMNKNIYEKESSRLKSLGYKGNIEKKMYKSTRYYYKNQVNIEPNKKKDKRKDYIELNKKFLNLIDNHLNSISNIEEKKPRILYNMFINDDKYQSYINIERKRLFEEGLDNIEITKKMKKTYKNKLYNFIRKK